jgi:hypothetical protein
LAKSREKIISRLCFVEKGKKGRKSIFVETVLLLKNLFIALFNVGMLISLISKRCCLSLTDTIWHSQRATFGVDYIGGKP